jgi:RNA polymerase sigma-70 factor (ECF subfamily)
MTTLGGIAGREQQASLVHRLQLREEGALGELYGLYGRVTYSLILRIVREVTAAEDLTQETFLRVWTRAHLLDPACSTVGPWLLTIARNRALDHLRASKDRVTDRKNFEDSEDPRLFADLEREIFNTDTIAALRTELLKLSDNQRAVIEMAYFEGCSQREIAAALGHPLGSVKTWARTGLVRLRLAMENPESSNKRGSAEQEERPPVVIRPRDASAPRMDAGRADGFDGWRS